MSLKWTQLCFKETKLDISGNTLWVKWKKKKKKASQVELVVKNLPTNSEMQETKVLSQVQENPLE